MATTTTTTTETATKKAAVQVDGKPNDHHRSTTKARYINLPAVDADGKVIPYPKRWGYSSRVFDNGEWRSMTFYFALTSAFVAFNQTSTAFQLYDYMHRRMSVFQVNFFATYLVTFSIYWAVAGLFAIADLTARPRWLFKYKVQPFQRVDGAEYWNIAKVAFRNFTVVVIPLVYLRATFTPARIDPRTLESPLVTYANIAFNIFCTELGFYFIHRFFHTPFMYQRFHKQHHYMTAPVALASTYCTMTEHIFSNLLPNAIGTALLKPHWSVQTFTFVLLSISTCVAHSGYNIPYLNDSLQHDWHHFAFNENFGPTGLFDWLLGTSRRFKSVLHEGTQRSKSVDRAREELLSKLARWEQDQH